MFVPYFVTTQLCYHKTLILLYILCEKDVCRLNIPKSAPVITFAKKTPSWTLGWVLNTLLFVTMFFHINFVGAWSLYQKLP